MKILAAIEDVLLDRLMTELPDLYAKTSRPEVKGLNICARECLRQMEWARRPNRLMNVTEVWDENRTLTTSVTNPPLDLAPPDWQP